MISIDGNVYTGKTTLARALAGRKGYVFVPEHSAFVRERVGSVWEIHEAYLDAELRRAKTVVHDAVLDRSILSLAAHTYAAHACGLEDMRRPFSDWLQTSNPISPPCRIVLVGGSELVRRRALRGERETPKGTAAIFYDVTYVNAVNEFYGRLAERVPLSMIDASQDADRVLEQALAIVDTGSVDVISAVCMVLR